MLLLKNFLFFLKKRLFLDKNELQFINHNEKIWKNTKSIINKKSVILLDLFDWYPWIYFWSYIVNIIREKYKCEIKFFYFNLYQGRASNISLYIHKLKKIYRSFNAYPGIIEYDFRYSNGELKNYESNFKFTNKSKKKILNYKRNGIKIGDLIYDTYLRAAYKPTIDLNDPLFKKIFFRAEKIFTEVEKFFNKHDVKIVIPSHVCYISYGIITRIALSKNIPVIKIRAEGRGNAIFRMLKINRKSPIDENLYYNYKKTFDKFSNKQKKIALKKGKDIINRRFSGKFDRNIHTIKKSQFKSISQSKISHRQSFDKQLKKKIFIFAHCYHDNPHRYRNMIFNDFYDQVTFLLNLSKKYNQYEWYYKPHSAELPSFEKNFHKKLLNKYPDVKYISKSENHNYIFSLKPYLIFTNHGTVAHEYAYKNIPVINTGDNPHINYNFCIHSKSKKDIDDYLSGQKKFKINFDKNKIYEYLYLHYDYFPNLYNENIFLKDNYFASRNFNISNSSKILVKNIAKYKESHQKIINYIKLFLKSNNL